MERPIRYIRESFFYGREFVNDDDLNDQAERWLEGTANVRRHGTTGERPVDRFERDERAALRPVANQPYRRLGARRGAAAAPMSPCQDRGRPATTAQRLCGGQGGFVLRPFVSVAGALPEIMDFFPVS